MTALISSVQSVQSIQSASEASTPIFTGPNLSGTSFKKRRRGPEEHAGKTTTTFNKRTKMSSSQSFSSSSSLGNSFGNDSSPSRNDPLVIKIGSQVAFRLRKHKGGEEEWIQCEVTKVITEGVRFEVQDPEPDEHNNPGQSYKTGIKDIIAIPIDHDNSSLPTLPPRTVVLARYPDTTTFYRAEVIVDNSKRDGRCRLKFEGEEEEGKETEVERRLVLPIK